MLWSDEKVYKETESSNVKLSILVKNLTHRSVPRLSNGIVEIRCCYLPGVSHHFRERW